MNIATMFGFLIVAATAVMSSCDGNPNIHCFQSEREALLKFKQHLIDESNRLSSWVEDTDCCNWSGVYCDLTGHVKELDLHTQISYDDYDASIRSQLQGKITSSLLELKRLSFLDLSYNDFNATAIPEFIGSLGSLLYLNLSNSYFSGQIPHKLGNLSKLQHLHLGKNYGLESKSLQWISGHSSLKYLDLNDVNLATVADWLQVTSNLTSLVELHLVDCQLNTISSPITISDNFASLAILDLSINEITRIAPTFLGNLCNLREIHLGDNQIDQDVSEVLQALSGCSVDNLETLDFQMNHLFGQMTDQLGQLKNLTYLSLSSNSISGPIPFSVGDLSSLKHLDVSYNRLNGTLPQSIGQLVSLEILNLGHNHLEGAVTEMHFSSLKKLKTLDASENMLMFHPNPNWIPPFECEVIKMSQWNLGPQFPSWVKFQKNLSDIDMSNSGISDVIPSWFSNLTLLNSVNLSYNQLVGGISYLPKSIGRVIDLSSNQFKGSLPQLFPRFFFLSENSLSGSLSQLLCNPLSKFIWVLHIDNNLLSAEIPDCWENLSNLQYLNLGNNNLTGEIPTSLGSLFYLSVLILRNNSLFGELPSTLQTSGLTLIDVGENHLIGSIPTWIGSLSSLVALGLSSNNVHGHIPDQICALSSLQILDLAHNNLSGDIPKCIGNLTSMATKNPFGSLSQPFISFDRSSAESMWLVRKGREDEYGNLLNYVTSLDLSNNSLNGEIPEELGSLKGLQSLNLSGNQLTGKIPVNIGNMGSLESVDFSRNRLKGAIPSSFSKLNFLSYLNLSCNNLTGQIPTSTQLQSFNESSYIGNHLCGPPISKYCSVIVRPNVTDPNGGSARSHRPKVNGLYVSMVIGIVVGFRGVMASLFFIRSWRITYYRKLDDVGRKLYVFWATLGK